MRRKRMPLPVWIPACLGAVCILLTGCAETNEWTSPVVPRQETAPVTETIFEMKAPETEAPEMALAAAEPAGVTVVACSETVSRGSTASVTIQGMPGAVYRLEVEFKSGLSGAKGLGEKTADAGGRCTWSWKIGGSTSLEFRPEIRIFAGSNKIFSQRFTVTEG